MKNFLINLLSFILVISSIFGINLIINQYYFIYKPYIIEKNIETVIMGGSLTMYSLNPEIIKNSINISQEAEIYEVTYFKLKYLLANNKKINNIILNFSPVNFSDYKIMKGRKKNLPVNTIFYNLIPIFTVLNDFNPDKKDYFHNYIKHNFFNKEITYAILTGNKYYPFIGEFKPVKESFINKKNWLEFVLSEVYYSQEKKENDILYLSLYYLFKIIDLCKENNINLLLINTPQKNEIIPVKFKIFYKKVTNYLIENKQITEGSKVNINKFFFSGVILDYSNDNLPDEYYLDHVHLNNKGANYLSQKIQKFLQEYLK